MHSAELGTSPVVLQRERSQFFRLIGILVILYYIKLLKYPSI
jgi:hypothetical protein